MKTLKKNYQNIGKKTWSKIKTCTGRGPIVRASVNGCGSILEIVATDVVYTFVPGAYMTDNTIYGFVCKECGSFTKLNLITIPKWVKEQAKELK